MGFKYFQYKHGVLLEALGIPSHFRQPTYFMEVTDGISRNHRPQGWGLLGRRLALGYGGFQSMGVPPNHPFDWEIPL